MDSSVRNMVDLTQDFNHLRPCVGSRSIIRPGTWSPAISWEASELHASRHTCTVLCRRRAGPRPGAGTVTRSCGRWCCSRLGPSRSGFHWRRAPAPPPGRRRSPPRTEQTAPRHPLLNDRLAALGEFGRVSQLEFELVPLEAADFSSLHWPSAAAGQESSWRWS